MNTTEYTDAISSVAEIIDEARNGRMFILVDHEDRENEGDLVIPAQMATPDAVNFMATHGRGLICLAMPGEKLDRLGLPLMAASNQSRHETAFTVSIEAREGVTTGISAHDRARTVAVATDPNATPADIATPGHVFPLRAREGGVLVRAGHTEAAVDVARLAGMNPAGVICEIMNEDGTMARLPDLVAFARFNGHGERGLVARLVRGRHQWQTQAVQRLSRHGQADQPAPMGRHEVDHIGRGHLRRDHEVAFVLAILVIDKNEHAHVARLVDDLGDGGDGVGIFGIGHDAHIARSIRECQRDTALPVHVRFVRHLTQIMGADANPGDDRSRD